MNDVVPFVLDVTRAAPIKHFGLKSVLMNISMVLLLKIILNKLFCEVILLCIEKNFSWGILKSDTALPSLRKLIT